MSKKKNVKHIIAVAIPVILLLAICFTCVTIYAKKEINKPKFKKPEDAAQQSVTELPKDAAGAFAYVQKLYNETLEADDVEVSFSTGVKSEGEIKTPFSEADGNLITFIRDKAIGGFSEFYDSGSEIKPSEAQGIPEIYFTAADIQEYTAEQGHTDEEGNVSDDGYYFITFTLDPACVDTESMKTGSVYESIKEKLDPSITVENTEITANSVNVSAKIDRVYDYINELIITENYTVKADVNLADEYAELLGGKDQAQIELPYETSHNVYFKHYGARFSQRSIVVQPKDMKALPAAVTVNSAATKEDYKLTFTPSVAEAVTIDADGVMTVEKLVDDPVIITMTLDYDGHTYTDDLTVYITEWEEETQNG
ncbi:MAG: hypothetical protein IK085_01120 [Clostridia bacterium]|nr:hypothetical protein [Clostridia bacterium]